MVFFSLSLPSFAAIVMQSLPTIAVKGVNCLLEEMTIPLIVIYVEFVGMVIIIAGNLNLYSICTVESFYLPLA